jgi:hypothetical protein
MNPHWCARCANSAAPAASPSTSNVGHWRPEEDEEYDTSMGRAQRVPAFIVADAGTVHCFENDSTKDGGAVMLRVRPIEIGPDAGRPAA